MSPSASEARSIADHPQSKVIPSSVLSVVFPLVAIALDLGFGFGAGTVCTDGGPSRTLYNPPCNLVDRSVKVHLGAQLAILIFALLARPWRSRSWTSTALAGLSVIVLLVASAVAFSAG